MNIYRGTVPNFGQFAISAICASIQWCPSSPYAPNLKF